MNEVHGGFRAISKASKHHTDSVYCEYAQFKDWCPEYVETYNQCKFENHFDKVCKVEAKVDKQINSLFISSTDTVSKAESLISSMNTEQKSSEVKF